MHYMLLVGSSLPTKFTEGIKFNNGKTRYIVLKNEDNLRILCRYLGEEESWERNCYLYEFEGNQPFDWRRSAGVSIISFLSNQEEEEAAVKKYSSP